MDDKSRALAHKMLHAAGEQLVPLEVANAGLGILCLALSKMDDVQRRDKLPAGVEAAVRSGVTNLLLAADRDKAEASIVIVPSMHVALLAAAPGTSL